MATLKTLNTENVKYIVVHCSATKEEMDIGADEIDRWHRERGFLKIGYHLVIRRNGFVETGRNLDEVGAHAKGVNSQSVGISLIGGVDDSNQPEDNFTDIQMKALKRLVSYLKELYPNAEVIGHRDVSKKACPSFDVKAWWRKIESSS